MQNPVDRTEDEWREIADGFMARTGFPTCLGPIDGKHIRIKKPKNSGSQFWNYKLFHSVILKACVDSNYEFIFAECGGSGRTHDSAALAATQFHEDLTANRLRLPPPELVGDFPEPLPYVFLGDEAYGLTPNFIQPFPQRVINRAREKFNKKQCGTRRYVECAFGMLRSKFGLLGTEIEGFDLDLINLMVLSMCILHNILRRGKRQHVPRRNRNMDENMMVDGEDYELSGEEGRNRFVRFYNDRRAQGIP